MENVDVAVHSDINVFRLFTVLQVRVEVFHVLEQQLSRTAEILGHLSGLVEHGNHQLVLGHRLLFSKGQLLSNRLPCQADVAPAER